MSLCQPSPAPHWLLQLKLKIHCVLSSLTASISGCLSARCSFDPQTLSQSPAYCASAYCHDGYNRRNKWIACQNLNFSLLLFFSIPEIILKCTNDDLFERNKVLTVPNSVMTTCSHENKVFQAVTLVPVWEVWDYEFWSVSDKQAAIYSHIRTILAGISVKPIVDKGQHLTLFW